MIKLFPYIYEPEKSLEVLQQTEKYFIEKPDIKNKIEELGWVYHSIGKSIPQTTENFWSGHYFPYVESWDELQISFNLVAFGLYKQAFMSLRNALEVGMLSVYYNIDDDGHKVVKDWLNSKDTWEANTPRSDKIWKILKSNGNINKFNELFRLEDEFNSLSFLHNFVHTKGYKFSNKLGIPKPNCQTFAEDIFLKWLNTYQRIIEFILILHILKYPISIIEYDWSVKIGIDNPFPVLEVFEIEKIKKILPKEYFDELKKIAENDKNTQDLFDHICNLPDMSENDQESQIIRSVKMFIEHGEGFIEWEKKERELMKECSDEVKEKISKRIEIIREWAIENNMMKSQLERLKEEGFFNKQKYT
ncbi:MAG: hypothetical protein QY331_07650 [Melioribacteraceae bacterium]|nr:MAG: hypothetical protein QY331_07650 [Melioribacteraceae bacterium]